MLNKIQMEAIKSRADKGVATSHDCSGLLGYIEEIEEGVDEVDFQKKILTAIECGIEDALGNISTSGIEDAVRSAILRIKN